MKFTPWCLRQFPLAFAVSIVMLLLPGVGCQGQAQAAPPIPEQDFKLSVNVDLVELHATVSDGKGRFVSDLKKQAFTILEDGVKQDIRIFQNEDVPVTVGLVVDHSRSMHRKLQHVLAAARAFVAASKDHDQMFVVNFNEYVTLGLRGEMKFTNNVDQLEAAILSAPIDGQTALYDAISIGLAHLRTGEPEKKVLIVISDGGDNVSKATLSEVLTRAGQSSALIYTIGIFDETSADRNPRALRRIASATGGAAFVPEEIEDVVSICEQIAREIRSQYTLGYFSSAMPNPGAERRLRVTAVSPDRRKLNVRTRDSYITAGEQVPPHGTTPK